MSTLVAHLPPLAELLGDDGEPISMAQLAQAAGPLALAGVSGVAGAAAFGSSAIAAPSLIDTDPAMLGALDLPEGDLPVGELSDEDFDDNGFDSETLDEQQLTENEVANDVREFAEEGVTFAEAGVPEPTDETTEWNLDSPLPQQSPDADEAPIELNLGEHGDVQDEQTDQADTEQGDDFEREFGIQAGTPPRPLAEVTDLGMGREERVFVPRPRAKRQAAPLKSIIGIVIGGLMAFPLAAGILALAGKPLDLGFWPFDGDTISMNSSSRRSAAPPIEPTPRLANNDRDGRSLAEDMPSLDVDPPSLADSTVDSLDAAVSDLTARPEIDAAEEGLSNMLSGSSSPGRDLADIPPPSTIELPPLDLSTPPATADEPEMKDAITDSADPLADPLSDPVPTPSTEPVPAEPAVEEIAATSPIPDEVPTVVEPPMTLPEVSPELQSALEEASAAMGAVVNYDDSEGVQGQRSRLASLFEKVAAVGATASIDDDAAVGSLVQRLVDNKLVATIAPAAPNWARYSKRPNNGMLATGKLRQENDQWFLDWNGPVPLEVRFTDPVTAENGASVIILGEIQQSDPSPIVEVTYLQKQ